MRLALTSGILVAALATAPTAAFAKVPADMMEASGDTVYSLQVQDTDNTNGGSGLLTLSPMRNGLVKVSEEGSEAYSDTKKLQHGQAQAGAGSFAVGNTQPDGSIKVIPEGATIKFYNIVAGILSAGPDKPKKGDTWKADVNFPGATGQAIEHVAMTATITDQTSKGMTISFDGNSDDVPMHGFLVPKIHLKTHTFGTIGIVGKSLETAEGETDSTMAGHGHNEKWSLKRG